MERDLQPIKYQTIKEYRMTDKIVSKGFKIRLYPTDEQKVIIEKTFGCCRFIYNNYLQEKNEFYIEHKLELKGKTKEEKAEIYSTFKRTSDKEYGKLPTV